MAKPKPTWDERRHSLLADFAALFHDLGKGRLAHVSTNIQFTYCHFYKGKQELGDLALGDALQALVEEIVLWMECGKERRNGDRPDLDIREADRIDFQSH